MAIFAPLATTVILFGLRLVFGSLRVGEEEEMQGLDLAEHSENAYGLAGSGSVVPEAALQGASLAMGLVARPQHEQVG